MKRIMLASLLSVLASVALADAPKQDPFTHGDPAAGASKAAACFACHGPNGNGAINPEWPKLAAQHSAYIAEELHEFKSQTRKQPIMLGQAAALSDDDMNNLAAFFAAQAPVPGVASKDSIAVAEKLYRGGDATRGIPACAACHGATGAGVAASAFPRLSGQNPGYTANQLQIFAVCASKDYKDCDRGSDDKGRIMSTIAAKLTAPEIQALASYVSGLQ